MNKWTRTLVLSGALFGNHAMADEGMWLFNNLPSETLKQKYSFEPTEQWATHLQKSSVRFNSGGSGSFISGTGLVLTNHHVAADTLAKVSTPQNNLYRDGFYAKTLAEEIKAPDLELNRLESMEDVTARVNAAVPQGATPEEAAKARRAVMSTIETESLAATGLRSDIVTLYQGGQYHLYRYKKYTDVRVVFAPEFSIAFLGGDPDNFEYPRYNLDMAIFRVYEDGKPAQIQHFLKWGGNAGASEDELIFVSGHPGRTSRIFTVAALEFTRDVDLPLRLAQLRRSELMLQLYAQKGLEQARQSKSALFSVQNSRKSRLAALQGLQNPDIIKRKQADEYKLLAKAESEPTLQQYTGAWKKVSDGLKIQKALILRNSLLESGSGINSKLFSHARKLVRLATESLKPNGSRLREYQDAARSTLEQEMFSSAPIYKEMEEFLLADSIAYLLEQLGPNDKIVQIVLNGKSPQDRARELVQNTALDNLAVRKLLAKGGRDAIDSSYDPMIVLAKSVDEAARSVRKNLEDKVQEPLKQAYAQIAAVSFAANGTAVYPDATFTLRLAFGTVSGYSQAGAPVPAWTTIGGAFEHELAHESREPYVLPKTWHDAKNELDLSTPFNFVSTADIIGGNSGSPVVNRDNKLVGLIFDGNIQSLTADFVYSDIQSRAVSVDVRTMTEAMSKIYKTEPLLKELMPL